MNNCSKYFSILILLIGAGLTFSQSNHYLDSLKNKLSLARSAQDSAVFISQIIWSTSDAKFNIPDDYLIKSLQLVKQIKNEETLAELYDAIALTYWLGNDVQRAKEYYRKAIKIGEQYNYPARIAWGNYNLATLARLLGNTREMVEYALTSRKRFKQLNNFKMILLSDRLVINSNTELRNVYIDSTISDSKIAISQVRDSLVLINAYLNLVSLYGMRENKSMSISYAMKALEIAEVIKDKKAILSASYLIGEYLRDYQHNYNVAMLYFEKNLDIYRKIKNESGIAEVLIEIGTIYRLMGKDSLAMDSFNNSLNIAKKINYRHLTANAYKSIGELAYQNREYNSALINYKKCFEIGCDKCPRIVFHKVLLDIGNVYLIAHDYKNALKYFNKSLFLADSSKALLEKASSFSAIADYYNAINNTNEAISYYEDALKLASSVKSLSLKKEISSKLSLSYKDKKDFQKAYQYLSLSNLVADTLNKITQVENISRMESKFELQNLTVQKERELKENQIRADAEIGKQAQQKFFFIIGFILMSALGFVLYRGIRQKKKDNKILEEQKKQIEEMSAKVHRADEEKISFFTNISHELKTPLTLILGPAERLMKENQGDEKITFSLSVIRRNAVQLFNYINQLLDLRKLESGKENLKVSFIDITGICKSACSTFSYMANEKNISLNFITDEKTLTGWIDKSILEKTLNNLLSNAIKHTNDGGEVNISLSSIRNAAGEISEIKLIVKDTGTGIPEEKVKFIFDKYYQVENANNGKSNGTGLGLAYTKELVELHKGKITVESNINTGTTFTVVLPVMESFYNESEKAVKEISKSDDIDVVCEDDSPEEKETLLIIEDNDDMRGFIKSIFIDEFKILEAGDGTTGCKIAVEEIPDVIISDIMMPGMNGFELCDKIKNNIKTNHIPVMLLTAKTGDENEIKGYKTGADDYLTKPFNSDLLEIRIKRLIETRERLRQYFTKEFLLNPSEVKLNSPEDEFLRKAVKVVEDNIENPDLNVELLMEELAVSRTQLFRKLKAITNYSANQFIRNIKLKRAAQLLRHHSYNITEVLYLSGFNSHSYFTSCFKEVYGCLPKEYTSREMENLIS